MKPVLFVGNGVNRLSEESMDWGALLDELAGPTASQHEEAVRREKPFTLFFEEILSSNDLQETKQKVANLMKSSVHSSDYHRKILALPIDDILTTNYDYGLEGEHGRGTDGRPVEQHHSLFRRVLANGKRIWHIHGEADNPATIMLGLGHYNRYLRKISNFLSTGGVDTKSKARDGKPYRSKFSKRKPAAYEQSWVDLFLERDLHIIGFRLDYTETHLWHLLTEKLAFSKAGKSSGKTFFYRYSTKKMSIADEARKGLLDALDVAVIDIVKESSYAEAFDDCLRVLSKELNRA